MGLELSVWCLFVAVVLMGISQFIQASQTRRDSTEQLNGLHAIEERLRDVRYNLHQASARIDFVCNRFEDGSVLMNALAQLPKRRARKAPVAS